MGMTKISINKNKKIMPEPNPKNKKIVIVSLVSVAIIAAVVAIIAGFNLFGNNKTVDEQIQQLTAAYKENGITLESEDFVIKNDEIEVTNEQKAQEYIKKASKKINSILVKYSPSAKKKAEDSASASGDTEDADAPDPSLPDLNTLLQMAKDKLSALSGLYSYFDNSQYIDMNTGTTYKDNYDKEYEAWNAKEREMVQRAKDEHPEMTPEEFSKWLQEHPEVFDGLPDPPTYDYSIEDGIDLAQLTKAYGFLSARGIGSYGKEYAESLGWYAATNDINTTNIMWVNGVNNPPFAKCLSQALYNKSVDFSAANAIVSEVDKSYADGSLVAKLCIQTNGYAIYYGISGDTFCVLDIEGR